MAIELDLPTEALVVESIGADFKMVPILLANMNDDEVLVEMRYSGICHTDIVLQRGLLPHVGFPAIFGHEGAGTILRVGAEAARRYPAMRPGAAVLLSFNTCGACRECNSDRPSFCHDHVRANAGCVRLRDGSTPARLASSPATPVRSQCFGQSSFARVSVVAARSVVVLPEGLLDDPASLCKIRKGVLSAVGGAKGIENEQEESILAVYAPLGCGFQTGAGTVLNVLNPGQNDSIVIFGMGSVGLAALMAARYLQVSRIVAVDVVEEKLATGREFGATDTVNSKGVLDVVAEIRRITSGGATYAIDCTGVIPVIESLVSCLQPGGTAVSVGVPPPGKVQIDALSFLMDNKRFIGVIEGGSLPQKFIPELITLHRQGNFPIDRLCKVYSVRDFEKAISDLRMGKVIKPVIKWDQ